MIRLESILYVPEVCLDARLWGIEILSKNPGFPDPLYSQDCTNV